MIIFVSLTIFVFIQTLYILSAAVMLYKSIWKMLFWRTLNLSDTLWYALVGAVVEIFTINATSWLRKAVKKIIFLKWQDCSVAILLDIAVIFYWRCRYHHGLSWYIMEYHGLSCHFPYATHQNASKAFLSHFRHFHFFPLWPPPRPPNHQPYLKFFKVFLVF